MIIGRIIGWIFLAAGLMVLGHDALMFLNTESWQPIPLGQLWYNLDAQGLNLVQAIIQRYLFPGLWDPTITTVLLWPAWLDFLVPGILLSIIFFKRRKPRESSFSA